MSTGKMNTVKFACPQCGKSLKARPEDAGRSTICSGCGTRQLIPGSPIDESVAAAPLAARDEYDDEPLLSFPPSKPQEDLIDMTAMVDIVFFLLIFFLVTSLQAVLAVMNLPTPQSASGAASATRSVAADYDVLVRIEDDDSIWVEDVQAFSDQDLRVRLRGAASEVGKPPTILVIGNADASTLAAVRVFDACAYAKVKNISFIVKEGDADQ